MKLFGSNDNDNGLCRTDHTPAEWAECLRRQGGGS